MVKPVDKIVMPDKFSFLLTERKRFKVSYSGRNGFKSWSYSMALIVKALQEPLRILCTREIQNSIKDSVHRLLSDTIARLGYGGAFTITDNEIRCKTTGSAFIFKGLRMNTTEIKSLEGIDICWVEEAESTKEESWDILIPTIRKPGSEIWVTFNTGSEFDYVYDKFVTNKPDDCVTVKTCYLDYPQWVPDVIVREAEACKQLDPLKYRHIWLGEPQGFAGKVFGSYGDAHLVDMKLEELAQCNCYMAIDPHYKYFPAIKWYAVRPDGCVVVYNEYPKFEDLGCWYDEARETVPFNKTMRELANVILGNDYSVAGAKILARIPDPRFAKQNPDFIRLLSEYGVSKWVMPEHERIEAQRGLIQKMQEYNHNLPVEGLNKPKWYVRRECRNSDRMYRRHMFDEKKDQEAEDYKDFIDCDRYFLSALGGKVTYKQPENKAEDRRKVQQLIKETERKFQESQLDFAMR